MDSTPKEYAMTNKTYIGVDPGQKGGIASIAPSAEDPLIFMMPKTPRDVFRTLRHLKNSKTLAVIERSQPMPKQGVVSVFSYGVGYGVLLGCLEALEIPYVEVRPLEWKKGDAVRVQKQIIEGDQSSRLPSPVPAR